MDVSLQQHKTAWELNNGFVLLHYGCRCLEVSFPFKKKKKSHWAGEYYKPIGHCSCEMNDWFPLMHRDWFRTGLIATSVITEPIIEYWAVQGVNCFWGNWCKTMVEISHLFLFPLLLQIQFYFESAFLQILKWNVLFKPHHDKIGWWMYMLPMCTLYSPVVGCQALTFDSCHLVSLLLHKKLLFRLCFD